MASDSPYGRTSNDQQPIQVSDLQLRLPALERPGSSGGFIKAPASKFVPRGYQLADEFKELQRPAAKPLGPPRLTGGKLLLRIHCPKAWNSCNRGLVRIHGAARSAKRLVAQGRFTRIGGGKIGRFSFRLRPSAMRYLRVQGGPRVRITVRTAERVEPVIVARPVRR